MIGTLVKQVKEFKKESFLTPLFTLIEVILETIIPFMMASIIDLGVEANNVAHIYRVGIFMTVTAGCSLLFGVLGGQYGAKASAGFARNLRKAMFENIQTFSFSNIDKYSTAGLVTRMTTDVSNIQNSYMMILRLCTRGPASLICALVMAYYINAKIATIYLIAVVLLGAALALIIKNAMGIFGKVFRKYDDLNASVQENITGIRVVKAFIREDHETKKFQKASENLYKMFVKAEKIVVWNAPLMQLTVYACIIGISWLGAKMIVGSTLTTGELMSLLAYCMNILMSLMMLSMVFVMIALSSASAERIAEIIEDETNLHNPKNPVYLVKDASIQFDQVDFSYDISGKEPVLSNINLKIHEGETIGVIGGTGSAKTSLVNLISRLYDVTKGKVLVGNRDVREYDLTTLRDEVSVVLQKNVLFSGTILDNLRWGNKEATEDECIEAAKLACADEFIETMQNGYHTFIEQGGSNVSGGQKQRICIARALLKNPKILILDDSTSAVDTATDTRIRNALKIAIPNTTKIIIAQRISSIQHADRIIVLEDGKISGFDTHEQLLKENSIYREVYESQMGSTGDFDEAKGEVE